MTARSLDRWWIGSLCVVQACGQGPDSSKECGTAVVAATGEPASLVLETGQERPLPAQLPGDLPLGRHRVEGRTGATTLVVAPGRCHLPAALEGGGRAWGWAAQLYAVRSRASWGIGDLGDLGALLAATAPLGAGFALLNPLHAALPAEADAPAGR